MEVHLKPLCSSTATLSPKASNSRLPQLPRKSTSSPCRLCYNLAFSTTLSTPSRFSPSGALIWSFSIVWCEWVLVSFGAVRFLCNLGFINFITFWICFSGWVLHLFIVIFDFDCCMVLDSVISFWCFYIYTLYCVENEFQIAYMVDVRCVSALFATPEVNTNEREWAMQGAYLMFTEWICSCNVVICSHICHRFLYIKKGCRNCRRTCSRDKSFCLSAPVRKRSCRVGVQSSW